MGKTNSSGQVLLVGVLIIALLLLTTEIYVYDLNKVLDEGKPDSFSDFILALRLGTEHVVTGSLANVSQGGSSETLEVNLKKWSSFVRRSYPYGMCILNFSLNDFPPYSSGIQTLWATNGAGTSGAYANFTLQLLGERTDLNLEYTVNITTTLLIQGTYKAIQGAKKEVTVICNLLNEGKPALAKTIALYYKNESVWLTPSSQNNYTIIDHGNGEYIIGFEADISSQDVQVSIQAFDRRDVYVQTNATCTEI